MTKRIPGLTTVTLACLLTGCDIVSSYHPPWLISSTSVQHTYAASYPSSRHSRFNKRARGAHRRYASRESSTKIKADLVTGPRADHAVADRAGPLPAAVPNPPVSLSLAGDSGDRERALHLLESADENLVRARGQRLSAAQKETYERASQLATRARRALADNDCAAASSLASKASSLASGIGGE